MRTTARRRAYARRTRTTLPAPTLLAVLAVLVGLALAGCGASGSLTGTSPPPAVSATPSATPTVSAPSDGVSLSALGFENGPVDRVFVPVGAQVSSRVDQTNNVTVVMTAPAASELQAFYRRTALANGFTVTADDAATMTLTFVGFGWTGTFTGDSQASALLLRPAS